MERITSLSSNHEVGRIQELEMRLKHMEALVKDMQNELEEIRSVVSDEDLKRLEKMRSYQAMADQLWHTRRSA